MHLLLFIFQTFIFCDGFVQQLKIKKCNKLKMINPNIVKKYEQLYKEDSFTDLLDNIDEESIKTIYFSSDMKKIYAKNYDDGYSWDPEEVSIVRTNTNFNDNVLKKAQNHHIKTYVLPDPDNPISTFSSITNGFGSIFSTFINVFFIISIIMSIIQVNSMRGNNGMPPTSGPFTPNNRGTPFFNNNNNNDITKDKENMIKSNISLSDWAGSPEIFEECSEVVSYLRNDTNYKNAGAEIPKGILLEGPPGTGKTLIAKAIASECDANFISVASSEFVEVFVGLGAQKVRNLFAKARDNNPCVLFIDEIDSIGKQRGTGINMGNDEREQTLNQLLAEMDGFNSNEGVLIIAATNRRDVLDSALLRPGRFDRIINVPLPDKNSRKEIFKVHTKNKKIEEGIVYDFLAELTEGFSGAQIKNLVNEAAILCAREGRTIISQTDLENTLEKLVIGLVKRTDSRNEETKKRVSIHECGHAILSAFFSSYFDLKKVTIQATYNGAGGYTLFNDKPESTGEGLYTKDALKKRLIVSMGGKAAETLMYGNNLVSLGAVQDLKTANQLAQSMVGNYGMGEKLEVFYNENTDSSKTPFLGRQLAVGGTMYSEKTKEINDKETYQLVKDAYKEAYELLSMNKEKLESLSLLLQQRTTLSGEEVLRELNTETII
jgi:cell division protease FtsH